MSELISLKKIVFLVSGGGGTLIFINEIIKELNLPISIIAVIGDRDCNALLYAKNSIYNKKIKYNKDYNIELKKELLELNPDFIITNFYKILDKEIVNLFRNKLINLHYSLLPSFGGVIGMETIVAAKLKNSKFIGTTAHLVDEVVDNGKILSQSCFSVDWEKDKLVEDTIFRSGCITLLNTLILVSELNNKVNLSSINLNSFRVNFSPNISFDISELNETFWEKIKKYTL